MMPRQYPKNICAHPNGLQIHIQRKGISFHAFVSKSHPTPLARAIEIRDRFLRTVSDVKRRKAHRPHRSSPSNTGVVGVTESTRWSGGKAYPCFTSNWSRSGRRHMHRFHYTDLKSREIALKKAITLRHRNAEAQYV
jgi:hypothetical protein